MMKWKKEQTRNEYGKAVLELSSLFAMLIYTLIGIGIAKALTLARPQDEI